MIHFVGAGPGALDLITVRGRDLLEKAQQVIYAGSLVNAELLSYTSEECEIYNSATMTLEEVIEKCKVAEAAGKMTVRLHTGDPSLYGAIKEQMDCLDKLNIAYEVVPGVSSFSGAAAALKAEYTLPGVSQTLIITRTAGRTGVPDAQSVERLAAHGASMALFLSTGLMEKLQAELLAGGYKADTPAALVYKATWPDELVVRGTVGELVSMKEKNGIEKTALVLVGEFLGDTYERSRLYDPSFAHEFRGVHK